MKFGSSWKMKSAVVFCCYVADYFCGRSGWISVSANVGPWCTCHPCALQLRNAEVPMINQRDLMTVPWRTGGYHKTAQSPQVAYSGSSLICHMYLLTRHVFVPAARQGSTKQDLLAPSSQLIFWGREDLFFSSQLSLLAAPLARTTGVGGTSPWALWETPWLPPSELKCLLWFSWCLSPCLCCCPCSQGRCRCRSSPWSLEGQREPHPSLHSPLLPAAPAHEDQPEGLKLSQQWLCPGCPPLCRADPSFTSLMLLNIWLPPSCHPATAHPLTDVNGYYIYPGEPWKLPWQWLWLLGNARS